MNLNFQLNYMLNTRRKSKIWFHTYIIAGLLLIIFTNSCKEEIETLPAFETGQVTDIDNNIYKTVKIGKQWWMAENLKVKKYRNGNAIPQAQSDIVWKDIAAAYCIYYNNANAPGLLYNWYAINDTNNIAPEGWHIPSDEEWKELEMYLGMSPNDADKSCWRGTHEGEKLKIEGTQGWTRFGNVWPTNVSGFTALAGGCRLFNGIWADPGLFSTGFWWSSTEHQGAEAWYRYLDYKNPDVFRSHVSKAYGFNVRCVKD